MGYWVIGLIDSPGTHDEELIALLLAAVPAHA
jgi:hypothetical protein